MAPRAKPPATRSDRETIRTVMQQLPVELTSAEWSTRAASLGQAVKRLRALQDEKKAVNATWAKTLKDQQEVVKVLENTVVNKVEDREVPCVEEKVHSEGVVQIVRTDTGEIVSSRGMEPGERQVVLDILATKGEEPAVRAARGDVPEAAGN